MYELIPSALLQGGPLGLQRWQWLGLPLMLLLAWSLGLLLGRISRALLGRLVAKTQTGWDDAILERMAGLLTASWALGAMYILLPALGLRQQANTAAERVLHILFLVLFFWALMRLASVFAQTAPTSSWARLHPAAQSLVPLGARVAKVVVVVLAVIAILSEMGYPVASLIAGLGIGGLALALAAQKTVENLFGAFSIGVDQPFKEGDFVRVGAFLGTVERIGLRSTQVRTLDRTLVTIPNGRLADMDVESLTARERMRLACDVGLIYGTTAAQMRAVLEGLERVLRDHPKIWPDAVVVRLKEFGASSLNIEVMAWFQTPEWSEFQLIRQEVLLQFIEIVERAGTSFAFPTQTVHLITEHARPVLD